jgi:hypothetical protein
MVCCKIMKHTRHETECREFFRRLALAREKHDSYSRKSLSEGRNGMGIQVLIADQCV